MNLQNIEVVANEACFSTNPNTKFEAEKLFMEFSFNLDVSHYPEILEKFSQTVLFVFLSYLDKKIPKAQDVVEIFNQLRTHAASWYQKNGQLKRSYDPQNLKSYVTNTLGMVLGRCMKHIYLDQRWKKQLIEYFKSESNPLFKLFLYKHFIEVVSTIDTQMEYVQYRTLIYSFQEKMIPMFLHQLYPYFISVTDVIKINQLVSMLPYLSQRSPQHHFELFKPEDKIISQLVFTLLRELISFKFNISFSEYDLQTEFENCMVSFPQSVLTHITSKQFLEALYFMLEKMVIMNYTGPYFDTSFECLKKILLSKITHLSKEQRLQLTRMHYLGLLRILQPNTTSEIVTNQVFECLFKFIHAYEFTDLQQAHINHLEMISLVKQRAMSVIQSTELSNQNPLYHSTCSLMFKIASQSIAISQQKYLQFYEQLCRDFYRVFFDAFISKGHQICGKSPVQKISCLQSILNEFFFHVNRIGTMNMGFMFNVILSRVQEVFLSVNATKIANFLFLITDIAEENFYDRSLVYESTSDEDLKILGNLIHKCFQFIDFYKKSSLQQKVVDVAILLFFQKILSECLSSISSTDQQIKIVSTTYKVINSYKPIPTKDENFLLFCFEEMTLSLNSEDYEKVEHVLEALYSLLLKLKWTLKREVFTQSRVSKEILQKTIELSRNSLQSTPALMKERRKLFKIITILSFDDILDSYRTNIDFVTESIGHDFTNHHYAKVTFDMSGICQNIETPAIYKYFLWRINERIGLQTLIKTLYQFFGSDLSMLQEVVYLNRVLVSDKALRMSSKQMSVLVYDLIDYSLPFLTVILANAEGEEWCDVLKEVFALVNTLLEASYINLFLIKRKSKQNFTLFLYNLINNILKTHPWTQHYPELSKCVFETMRLFLTNCTEVILNWQEQSQTQNQFISKFIQFIQCAMYYCLKYLQQTADGGKETQNCQKLLETISKFYSLIRYKQNFTYRKLLMDKIQRIVVGNQQFAINFLQSLYRLSMSNLRNNSSILNLICVVIMQLSYIYTSAYKSIFLGLGIGQEKIRRFEKIYRKIEQSNVDSLFVINLKEWLSESESNYEPDFDY